MANIGQLKAVFSLRFETIFDSDGDGLPDDWEIAHSLDPNDNGSVNPQNGASGLFQGSTVTNGSAYSQGVQANPNATLDDKDGDLVKNWNDAEPDDSEINWERTPEAKYVWMPQVEKTGATEISRHGQILFPTNSQEDLFTWYDGPNPNAIKPVDVAKVLWDFRSQKWVALPPQGYTPLTTPWGRIYRMNDEGTIMGISLFEEDAVPGYAPFTAMMLWEPLDTDATLYNAPRYLLSDANINQTGALNFVMPWHDYNDNGAYIYDSSFVFGDLGEDDSVTYVADPFRYDDPDILGWVWPDLEWFDSEWVVHKEGDPAYTQITAFSPDTSLFGHYVLLDQDRCLTREIIGTDLVGGWGRPSVVQSHKLWLYELGNRTELTFMDPDGYETNGYGTNALGYAPSLRDDNGKRLWVRVNDKAYLEKRDGSNGQSGSSRWCEPKSLNEGFLQMRLNGEAITKTKVWRNGKYTPINDLVGKPESSDLNVTKLIDLASNGIILAEATENGITKTGLLMPVVVIELSPKLVDEKDVEIANSEKPASLPESTEMVERDPLADPQIINASAVRIAWRDMKVKIGKIFAGKEVTWSMTPQFTPSEEFWPGVPYPANYRDLRPVSGGHRFRGSWTHAAAANHKHRFSPSTAYVSDGLEGNYNFNNFFPPLLNSDGDLPQGSFESEHDRATTTVDSDGYTAIRVNMPPIGFNKARIKIQIEDTDGTIDLINMEVPAIVTIDPGHGGADTGNPLVTVTPKLYERDLTLQYSTELKTVLQKKLLDQGRSCKILVGKQSNADGTKYANGLRALLARDQGADIHLALHFNGGSQSASGTQVYVIREDQGNVNHSQDLALATRMYAAGEAVFGTGNRDVNQRIIDLAPGADGHVFLRDTLLNNVAGAGRESTFIRATLLELEYLTSAGVANKLTGPNTTATRQSYGTQAARAIFNDLSIQP